MRNLHTTVPEITHRTSIDALERVAALTTATAVVAYGLSRRNLPGVCLAAAATPLAYRGLSGEWPRVRNGNSTRTGTRTALAGNRGIHVRESVRLEKPIDEVYRFWRNLENLPQFMRHLDSVEKVTDTISHWKAKGPGGTTVEWNAEIYNEEPSKLIAWRSIEGSDVVSAGSVNFDNAGPGRGTRVTVNLQYSPPGGKIGARIARLFGRDAATEIREDLRRFKQLVEAGEVPTTSGQPRG